MNKPNKEAFKKEFKLKKRKDGREQHTLEKLEEGEQSVKRIEESERKRKI